MKSIIFVSLILIFVLNIFVINNIIPAQQWINENIITTDDFPMLLYSLHTGRVWSNDYSSSWGYSPYFFAGWIDALSPESIKDSLQFFNKLFPVSKSVLYLKLYFLLTLISIPIIFFWASKNFGMGIFCSFLGSCLIIIYSYIDFITFLFIKSGAFIFVLASLFSLYTAATFYKYIRDLCLRNFIIFLIAIHLAVSVHKGSFILLAIPLTVLYLFSLFRIKSIFFHSSIIFTLISIFIVNYNFFIPFQTFSNSLILWQKSSFLNNIFILLPNSILSIPHIISFIIVVLFIFSFGCSGIILLWKDKKYLLASLFFFTCLFFSYLVFFGQFATFTSIWQPVRFIIPLGIFLTIPASYYMNWVLEGINKNKIALFFPLVITASVWLCVIFFKILPGDCKLSFGLPNQMNELIAKIKVGTDKNSRILLQDSNSQSDHQYYGGHLPALLPFFTDREYIGGPTAELYFLKNQFAQFVNAVLFNKNIEEISFPELKQYLDLYNIGWIICWSDISKKIFNKYAPYITKIEEIDKFFIYKVDRVPSFFYKGSGKVKATYNEISIEDIVPQDGEIILKYHWIKTFCSKPRVKIEPVYILDDPIGFIKVIDPPKRLLIYNNYNNK